VNQPSRTGALVRPICHTRCLVSSTSSATTPTGTPASSASVMASSRSSVAAAILPAAMCRFSRYASRVFSSMSHSFYHTCQIGFTVCAIHQEAGE
jgi:hypothetical protein